MKKRKKNNTKAVLAGITITLLLIIVAVLVIVIQNLDVIKHNNMSTYEEILYNDLRVKYPTDYNDVMKHYDKITTYLFSNEITEEQIPDVVEQQRYLLSDEIIILNSFTSQIEEIKRQRAELKLTKDYILSMEHETIVEDPNYPNYADVNVVQYMKSGTNVYLQYTLKKYGEQWKIATWEVKGLVDENE